MSEGRGTGEILGLTSGATGSARRQMGRRDKPKSNEVGPALAKARAHWDERRFDEAIKSYNQAVRLAPNDCRVLLEASRALGARYQIERGLALADRALRLAPRQAEVLHAAGETYLQLGRIELAEACFRRACRVASSPASQVELAQICERRHALDEADELTNRALRVDPKSPRARLLRARLDRRRGDPARAEAVLRALAADAGQPPRMRAEAYGDLGTLLDAAGQYDAAWDALLDCKRLMLERAGETWAAAQFVAARCQRMFAELTPDHVARWQQPIADEPRRVALLTGFPRSGTTLLEQVLEAHPDVVASEEKEVFGADVFVAMGAGRPADSSIVEILDELPHERILDARRFYLNSMEAMRGEALGARLHVDKNPTMNPMIPPMRRVFPELKLIVALRDPRDVVVSAFLRFLPVNPISVCYLTPERTADRYVQDMGGWLKLRAMIDDWVEVRYEHAVQDLEGEARRMFAALELPWFDGVMNYRERTRNKVVQSPTYEQVTRPVYETSVGRWRNYERQLGPVLERLAPIVEALGYGG